MTETTPAVPDAIPGVGITAADVRDADTVWQVSISLSEAPQPARPAPDIGYHPPQPVSDRARGWKDPEKQRRRIGWKGFGSLLDGSVHGYSRARK